MPDTDKLRSILATGGAGINNSFAFDPLTVYALEAQLQEQERQAALQEQILAQVQQEQNARNEARGGLTKLLQNPTAVPGLSEGALAALRGQAIEDVPGRFDTAQRNLNTNLARRGILTGQGPASGVAARPLADLTAQRERERAAGLRGVTLADEEARRARLDQLTRGYSALLQGNDLTPLFALLSRGSGGGLNFGSGGIGAIRGSAIGPGGGGYAGGGIRGTEVPTLGSASSFSPGGATLGRVGSTMVPAAGAFATNAERAAYNSLNNWEEYARNRRNPPLTSFIGGNSMIRIP